jgi:hypothetical protein
LFDGKEKIWKRARVLREAYWNTGKQPAELGEAEVDKLLQPYKDNWLATIIVHQEGWNAIVGAVFIIVGILFLESAG